MDQFEILAALILELGAEGYQDHSLEEDSTQGADFFFSLEDPTQQRHKESEIQVLMSGFPSMPSVAFEWREVFEDDWVQTASHYYHAAQASEHIIIGPPNERDSTSLADHQHYIAVEFGPAFGTGGHPTTRLCIQLFEGLDSPPQSVLDIGTGTGVLSFAALCLGSEFAVGMDLNPKAQKQFLHNAEINHRSHQVHYIPGSTCEEAQMGCLLAGIEIPDLIFCNMLSAEFASFLKPLAQLRKPMILSGYMSAEVESIRETLRQNNWQIEEELSLDEWAACRCISLFHASE